MEMRGIVKNSLKIGGAFVGLMIGGGFASGQEILQYFIAYGWYGILGAILASLIFAFLGMNIATLGHQLKTTSHKEVVLYIAGPTLGSVMDCLITVFSFCFTIAMFAATASTFELLFGVNGMIGSIVMMVLTISTLMLNVNKIIDVLALATPYLLAIILVIVFASLFTMDGSFIDHEQMARTIPSRLHWTLSSLLYVSYNIAVGLPMLAVMGSTVKSKKEASFGGMMGGFLLGLLILLVYIALLAKMDVIYGKPMPTLVIAMDFHPIIGGLMALALMLMIFSTAVGVFYAFVIRFVTPSSKGYKPFVVFTALLAFFGSFIGFMTIVQTVYAIMGYLGFLMIAIILWAWMKKRESFT